MLTAVAESLVAWLVSAYIVFVGLTSRLVVIAPIPLAELRRPRRPIVFAFWHNRIAYFAWLFRGTPAAVPISTHRDGRIAARIARLFGFRVIPGSTSRNPLRVLKSLVNTLENGLSVGITPDGPRGPLYTVQDGLLYAAWKTGAPLIGAAWYARHVIRLRSWDRFILPLPFNTFVLHCTRPFTIPAREEIPRIKVLFRTEFARITRETETFFH